MTQDNKIYFMHFRQETHKGGFTVAYRKVPDDGYHLPRIEFTIARCHEGENFNRRIGRAVSSGRLLKGKDVITIRDVGEKEDIRDMICRRKEIQDANFMMKYGLTIQGPVYIGI
ncbi:MAG: hypothetical protein KGI54_17430 [Pseudomonadota bacterium]|nr:hypothetical protein [Pseudomonadota bacterium]